MGSPARRAGDGHEPTSAAAAPAAARPAAAAAARIAPKRQRTQAPLTQAPLTPAQLAAADDEEECLGEEAEAEAEEDPDGTVHANAAREAGPDAGQGRSGAWPPVCPRCSKNCGDVHVVLNQPLPFTPRGETPPDVLGLWDFDVTSMFRPPQSGPPE